MKKELISTKKGIALNQAFGAVLTLVLVATLVIVGILLFVNLGATFTNLDTSGANNETVTSVTQAAQFVDQSPTSNGTLCNFEDFAVSVVTNATGGETLTIGNYTVVGTGTIAATAGSEYNDSNWNVTYSSNWGGESCVASNAMVTQFATYPVLIGLVGTIIFLGLVIGVLVASFVFGGRREF